MLLPQLKFRSSYIGISNSNTDNQSKTPVPRLPRLSNLSRNYSNQITISSRNSNYSQHYSERHQELDVKIKQHLENKDNLTKQYKFQNSKKSKLEQKLKEKDRKFRLSLLLHRVYGYQNQNISELSDEEMIEIAMDHHREKMFLLAIKKIQHK